MEDFGENKGGGEREKEEKEKEWDEECRRKKGR